MRTLVNGIIEYRRDYLPQNRARFAQLGKGQHPDTLFIACSDSRVVPNLFASTHPGELFVIRNIGNMVPKYDDSDVTAHSEIAALEYALLNLNVKYVVVCGHTECGAMGASLALDIQSPCLCHRGQEKNIVTGTKFPPAVQHWLQHTVGPVVSSFRAGATLDPKLSEANQLAQMNVLHQINNLLDYPVVKKRVEEETLSIHGWIFDVPTGDVYAHDEEEKKFVLIDEDFVRTRMEEALEGID